MLNRLSSAGPGVTMRPGLVLVLVLAALSSGSTSVPEDNTGKKFVIVFPENIAYYYPKNPQNKVQITALYNNTSVTITQHTLQTTTEDMYSGESREFQLDTRLELLKIRSNAKTLVITSTRHITVHAISMKHNSVQTAMIIPAEKLGKDYLIPPVPTIRGTNDQVTFAVTERNPFHLLIISADLETKVTISGPVTEEVTIQPHSVAKIWVQEAAELRAVKANQPVAVLFGHPCAIRHNCTCGLLYNLLLPTRDRKLKFFIPPVLADDVLDQTVLLLSDADSPQIKPFNLDSPLVETAGTAILYRPGLLLTLIPEADFASCFVVNKIPDTESFAVIMVHKDFTDGVRIGSLPLDSPDWQKLKGTQYVSTAVELVQRKNIIWHTSFKMAVYFTGKKGDARFGNPAPIISTSPDVRGCTLSPEVLEIGDVVDGWRESLKYCSGKNLELISMSSPELWAQIHRQIMQSRSSTVKKVWIGLRRSSQTGEWYWLNNHRVSDTNWEKGEPGTVHDGQCAIMSLDKDKDFGWSDEDCCKAFHPVCYREPVILL